MRKGKLLQQRGGFVLAMSLCVLAAGCGPDQQKTLKEENDHLREQAIKQESAIASLQESDKFAQQQLYLLTREARDAKKETERLESERQKLAAKLEDQLGENRRLTKESQDVKKPTFLLQVDDKGGQSKEVAQALSRTCKAIEEVLSRNGYAVRASLKADKRAVYITERKNLAPASLELSGFRNQYLLSLLALSPNTTRLVVKAEFEKIGQGGRLLLASPDETAEIERRLLSEVTRALAAPGRVS